MAKNQSDCEESETSDASTTEQALQSIREELKAIRNTQVDDSICFKIGIPVLILVGVFNFLVYKWTVSEIDKQLRWRLDSVPRNVRWEIDSLLTERIATEKLDDSGPLLKQLDDSRLEFSFRGPITHDNVKRRTAQLKTSIESWAAEKKLTKTSYAAFPTDYYEIDGQKHAIQYVVVTRDKMPEDSNQ